MNNVLEKQKSLFEIVQEHFDTVSRMLGLALDISAILRQPTEVVRARISLRMDDGELRVIEAGRAWHNNVMGPYRGGIRLHPADSLDSASGLAMWMTWRHSLFNIPLGGAMGICSVDPQTLSPVEKESLMRRYVRTMFERMGENIDILSLEVGATPSMMGWVMDEYSIIARRYSPAVVTGKPLRGGGSEGRIEAVGYGVAVMVREAIKSLGLEPEKLSVSIQGFDNVGQHAAIEITKILGCKIICISCWDRLDRAAYSFSSEQGISPDELLLITDQYGSIDKEKAIQYGYKIEEHDAWLKKDVDILIPAAFEGQIRAENVNAISEKVKIIAEAAIGTFKDNTKEILRERGVLLIPSTACTGGALIINYFEYVQSKALEWWSKETVLKYLDWIMTACYKDVFSFSKRENVSMHDAADMLAISRVANALQRKGY